MKGITPETHKEFMGITENYYNEIDTSNSITDEYKEMIVGIVKILRKWKQ